ncbi:MAG: PD-(D/E)XK nuclease family protein [Clostridia bacterium]|nr:PD-(D/E)XK nuclease family protein [Clostridia bacterium]
MKLNYLLSDTTKRATTAALTEAVKFADANPLQDVLILVPESKSIIIEKEILNLSKRGASINLFVYSFVRLINRMGLVSSDKIANKQTSVMLLRKIIYENLKNLNCYKLAATSSSFAEKMYETIAQFKSSGLVPDDLKKALLTQNELLKQKLLDIILIYECYENELSGSLFDDQDKLKLLENFAKTSEFIKNSHVFVVGFDNITPQMQGVLKTISASAKSVTFSAVFFNPKRSDKRIQSNELFYKYTKIADELSYPYNPVFVKNHFSGDFYNLANFLFSTEKRKVASDGAVKVFELKTKTEEVEFIANSILKEVEAGLRFKDIGVMVSAEKENFELLEKTFKIYSIPYYINKKYDISNHFYIKFLEDCFELYSSHLSSRSVLQFMSSVLFDAKNFNETYNFVLERGIDHGDFLNLNVTAGDVFEDLQKVKIFYEKLQENLKKSIKIADFVRVIDFINETFDVKNKLNLVSDFEKENGLYSAAELTSKIFDKLEEYKNLTLNFLGEKQVNLAEFMDIYFAGAEDIKVNLLPASVDSVIIQTDTDGFYNIRDLFIMDAVQGKFPASILDTGVIADDELAEAKEFSGKKIEPTVKEINERENFRVYESLIEPREKLFISYSLTDEIGAQTKRSNIVSSIIDMFGEENVLFHNFEKFSFATIESATRDFVKAAGLFNSGYSTETLAEINRKFAKIKNNLSKNIEKYLNNLNFNQNNFKLNSPNEIYFNGNRTSISQLEKYFACPYQFFVNYGLRLRENKVADLSKLDIGTIIHRVAELVAIHFETLENIDSSNFEKQVDAYLLQALTENSVNVNLNKAVLKLIKAESLRFANYLIFERKNSAFKTRKNGTEYSFYGDSAVKLKLSSGEVISIEGKIDRIDEFMDYIRIIDYKTGNVESKLNSVYFGTKIQLVSYLSAVDKKFNKQVAALFYLPVHNEFQNSAEKYVNPYKFEGFLIKDAEILKYMDTNLSFENPKSNLIPLTIKHGKDNINNDAFEISHETEKYLAVGDFENLKNYTNELCKNAIEEILSGNIEPSPYKIGSGENPSACEWCKFGNVCDKEYAKFSMGRNIDKQKVTAASFEMKNQEKNG